jgi:hypothetical protein
MQCARRPLDFMRLTRKCLRAFPVWGVDDLSKYGLKRGGLAALVTHGRQGPRYNCRLKQDPHPVLRSIFGQAGSS